MTLSGHRLQRIDKAEETVPEGHTYNLLGQSLLRRSIIIVAGAFFYLWHL